MVYGGRGLDRFATDADTPVGRAIVNTGIRAVAAWVDGRRGRHYRHAICSGEAVVDSSLKDAETPSRGVFAIAETVSGSIAVGSYTAITPAFGRVV